MELVFAYVAGLLTLINPCVLPVLPIVLGSSLQADKRAPMALALGMSISFVVLGLGVTALGPAIGLRADDLTIGAAVAMILFGAVMLIPAFGRQFASATSGIAARADAQMGAGPSRGLGQEFLGGALLGAVWSPCIGPTLGAAIALASTGQELGRAAAIMIAFALGVSTLILAAAYGLRHWMRRNMARLAGFAANARPIMGAIFILVGLALVFRLNHLAEAALINVLPAWLIDLSVAL